MSVYKNLLQAIEKKGAAYLVLIDPDKISGEKLRQFAVICEESGADALLVGGSLMINGDLYKSIEIIKSACSLPAIIFPGSVSQVTANADSILFISLISGRNAEQLIGNHVMAAPIIKKHKIEPISTGYILVESGKTTTVDYISGTKPVPRHKPEIAAATALAAEYLGMKMVYLEAGSGADNSVPDEMVKTVSGALSIPVIVGGGIRDADTARRKVENGAKVIVTGNFFENESRWELIKDFAKAVHYKE